MAHSNQEEQNLEHDEDEGKVDPSQEVDRSEEDDLDGQAHEDQRDHN